MKYDLTIGIPVYNPDIGMFKLVLNNLLHATKDLKNHEVILGIQECSEETWDYIYECKKISDAIHPVQYDKSISTRAKNRTELMKMAQGEVVILIDQDVSMSKDLIYEHQRVHKEYDNAYVAGKVYNRIELNNENQEFMDTHNLNNVSVLEEEMKKVPCMIDPRLEFYKENPHYEDVTKYNGCWRHFWSCNISFRKEFIDRIGYFDNEFLGWGVEDDELAFRAYNMDSTMIFSFGAWGFHYPHPIDYLGNHNDWLRNMRVFKRKAKNIEVECYSVFMSRFDFGFDACRNSFNTLKGTPNLDFLIKRYNSNGNKPTLSLYINNHFSSDKINFDYNINPLLTKSKQENGCYHLSSIGINTMFQDKEIEDTVVILDYLFYVDIILRPLILLELGRISQNIIAYKSPFFSKGHNSENARRIYEILNSLNANVNYI